MAKVAGSLRLLQPELASVHVVVAPFTSARREPIARSLARFAVRRGRAVTSAAGGLCVRAGERPNAVVDLGQIPIGRGVARRAAVLLHLLCELVAVRVFVTVRSRALGERPIQALARARQAVVALGAGNGGVVTGELETGRCVEGRAEQRGTKPGFGMAEAALAAVALREAGVVRVRVAAPATVELQLPIADIFAQRGLVATGTGHRLVLSHQWIGGFRVRREADLWR